MFTGNIQFLKDQWTQFLSFRKPFSSSVPCHVPIEKSPHDRSFQQEKQERGQTEESRVELSFLSLSLSLILEVSDISLCVLLSFIGVWSLDVAPSKGCGEAVPGLHIGGTWRSGKPTLKATTVNSKLSSCHSWKVLLLIIGLHSWFSEK